MAVRTAKISDPVGLHLRAASRIVQVAKRFESEIRIAYGGDADELAPLGLAVTPDRYPGTGPLGGVLGLLEMQGGRNQGAARFLEEAVAEDLADSFLSDTGLTAGAHLNPQIGRPSCRERV